MKFNPYTRFLQPGQTVMIRRFERGILVDAEPEVFHVNRRIEIGSESIFSYDEMMNKFRLHQDLVPIKKEEQQQRILDSGRFDIVDMNFVGQEKVNKIKLKHEVKQALNLNFNNYSDSEACYYEYSFHYSQKVTEELFNKNPIRVALQLLNSFENVVMEQLAEKRKLLNKIANE